MTEEQKQALIDTAKEDIHFLESVRERRGNLFDLEEHKLALMRIALVALTAPPVKLPKRHSMLWKPDFREGYQSCMAFRADEVIAAISAAGYEAKK